MANCTNFRRLRRANLCKLFVKNLTVSTQKLKTRLIASPMSRPKEGRPIDKRKEYLVRGVELLGTVPQKPNCNQNRGDSIETKASKKTPVTGIIPCHPSCDCGGDTIQQYGNDENNSNENHNSTPFLLERNLDNTDLTTSSLFSSWCNGSHTENLEPCRS